MARRAAKYPTVKRETLERIEPLLNVLRAHSALREVRPTEFELRGRDFVHFHEGPGELVFADARLSTGFVHLPVSSPAQQADFLDRIDHALSSLESHLRVRRRRNQ
jgi:hypothetical protein